VYHLLLLLAIAPVHEEFALRFFLFAIAA